MAQPFAEPCSRGVIAAEPCPRDQGREIAPAQRRIVLTACIIASSMAFIDGSVLTVALPRLREDFGTDFVSVQWVLNGYVLALASLTLIGGALADAYGRARILALGCIVFGLASAACALAPSVALLVVARIVQGIAAAIVTPASLALIGAIYPREERNHAIGVWAAASALTTAGGPILGGWLTENFGWPLVFWINPPLALITVVLLLGFAPEDSGDKRPFDVIGAAILATSLAVLAWALSQIGPVQRMDTAGPAVLAVAVAIVAALGGFAAYAVWERKSDHAMTPPRLWRNRAFVGLNLATVMIYVGLSLMFFLLSFDLIERRRLSATEAGLAFLPFTLGVGLFSGVLGTLADKIGPRAMLVAGPLGAAAAYAWMALAKPASLWVGVIGPMALLGLSFAVLITPLTATVMSSVDDKDEGLASGVNNTASRVAQLAGIALAAGLASFASGYEIGFSLAAFFSAAGAIAAAATVPPSTGTRERFHPIR
jgi:EmrB/QacA subfamily drug resistance transporter